MIPAVCLSGFATSIVQRANSIVHASSNRHHVTIPLSHWDEVAAIARSISRMPARSAFGLLIRICR